MILDDSDFYKIMDALAAAVNHHKDRDRSNAALHLARETRYSPLTSTLDAALDRMKGIETDNAIHRPEEAPDAE
jgi:hypothetical protein